MKKNRIDLVLNVVESLVCILGVIVFSMAGVIINEGVRFFFIICDFYVGIRLANCIEYVIMYFKRDKIDQYSEKSINSKALNDVMYWS